MTDIQIIDRIDEAIEKSYIKVYLQPIFRTLTNDICEFEALARWDDPELGFLAPYQFIPVLEEADLIYKLDMFMIEEVCKTLSRRLENGKLVLPVSFNLSRKDMLKLEIFTQINEIVDRYKLPHEYIQIEVTESALLDDTKEVINMAATFRQKNFEVWMDDFGEGYSSLNMLASCDFDLIKLDMGFMRKFNEKTKIVLENVVRMAKQLGMQTLSEGVETKEQYDYLRQIGCEKIQGYYFSKPLPMDEALDFMDAKSIFREDRNLAKYFSKVGSVGVTTDKALIIYELVDDKIKTLFYNKAIIDEINTTGISSVEALEEVYNDNMIPLSVHFREYLKRIDDYNEIHEYDYTAWNYYIRYKIRKIASLGDRTAFETETLMFSKDNKSSNLLFSIPESTFYEFTEECMIGVSEIDEEHKHFFDLANKAVSAVNNSEFVDDEARQIIADIKAYAHTHFAHEEAYMSKIKDPILTVQKIQHQQFIETADAIDESKFSKEEYMETVNFIVQWLYKHIIGSDTLIGKGEDK